MLVSALKACFVMRHQKFIDPDIKCVILKRYHGDQNKKQSLCFEWFLKINKKYCFLKEFWVFSQITYTIKKLHLCKL